MLRRTFIPALAALLATTLVATAPAFAQRGPQFPGSDWDNQRDREPQQRDVSLSSVIRDLKMRYGGQHLDAQKVGNRYVIAWITGDGKRLTIEVEAATGRIISTR